MPPDFSVIVPVYDGVDFLEDALQSVARQTLRSWECIVVDDGSRDGSIDCIERWRRRSGVDIEVLRHPGGAHRGLPATRNLGASHARGRWLAFLDQDDLWLPHKLATQLEFMTNAPELDASGCLPEVRYEGVEPPLYVDIWARSLLAPQSTPADRLGLGAFLTGCPIFMSGAIVRRTAFQDIGGFCEDLPRTSDWLLWGCLASRSPLGLLPAALGVYRFHGGNEMARLASEPLGLALACIEIVDRLTEWIAADRSIDRDDAEQLVRHAADWLSTIQRAGIQHDQWWRLLSGV